MKSAFRLFTKGLFVVATAMLAGPVLAQSLPSGGDDPFSEVPSVDNDQMSDVKGNAPGAANARTQAAVGGDECGAAPCGGPVGTDGGSTATNVSTNRNVVTVNVTAIVNQSSTISNAVLNTSGGSNSAGTN
ncbi:MAG: hypothetical protein ACREIB_04630 [Pseudomonadota bacterium]